MAYMYYLDATISAVVDNVCVRKATPEEPTKEEVLEAVRQELKLSEQEKIEILDFEVWGEDTKGLIE